MMTLTTCLQNQANRDENIRENGKRFVRQALKNNCSFSDVFWFPTGKGALFQVEAYHPVAKNILRYQVTLTRDEALKTEIYIKNHADRKTLGYAEIDEMALFTSKLLTEDDLIKGKNRLN